MLLDIALTFTLALGFLKGADLLFRPHQRKAAQAFVDDLTLRMSDLDFRELAKRLGTPEAQFCFVVLAYMEFALFSLAAYVIQAPMWRPGGMLRGHHGQWGWLLQTCLILVSIATLVLCWRRVMPALIRLIVGGSGRWMLIFLRFVAFTIASGAAAIGYLEAADAIGAALGPPWQTSPEGREGLALWIGLALIWPAFTVYWVVVQAIGAMLQVRLPHIRWLFRLVQAVLWRLSEYDKGVVAAAVLVLSGVLAMAKALTVKGS